jgi:hypothetical protein
MALASRFRTIGRVVGPTALLVASVVFVGGCSGAANGRSGDAAATPATSRTDASGAEPSDDANTVTQGRATLKDVLGVDGSLEGYARAVSSEAAERERLVRACMEKDGFEYIEHTGGVGNVVSVTGLPTNLSPREFKSRYGYGVAPGFESLLSRDRKAAKPSVNENPNDAIVDKLSPAAKVAYEKTRTRCVDRAREATDKVQRLYKAFGSDLDKLAAAVRLDPRLVSAVNQWVRCMEERGYRYADEDEIRNDLLARLRPLNSEIVGEDVPQGAFLIRGETVATDSQRSRLHQLVEAELRIAKEDLACSDESRVDAVRATVNAEFEAAFVAGNSTELHSLFPSAKW